MRFLVEEAKQQRRIEVILERDASLQVGTGFDLTRKSASQFSSSAALSSHTQNNLSLEGIEGLRRTAETYRRATC